MGESLCIELDSWQGLLRWLIIHIQLGPWQWWTHDSQVEWSGRARTCPCSPGHLHCLQTESHTQVTPMSHTCCVSETWMQNCKHLFIATQQSKSATPLHDCLTISGDSKRKTKTVFRTIAYPEFTGLGYMSLWDSPKPIACGSDKQKHTQNCQSGQCRNPFLVSWACFLPYCSHSESNMDAKL